MEQQKRFTARVSEVDPEVAIVRWRRSIKRTIDWHDEQVAAEFVALVNAPAASPEVLPEGIEAGYNVPAGVDVAEGWQRVNYPEDRQPQSIVTTVERVPAPETVLMDWVNALVKQAPLDHPDGPIRSYSSRAAGDTPMGVVLVSDDRIGHIRSVTPDINGQVRVSVLVEGDR